MALVGGLIGGAQGGGGSGGGSTASDIVLQYVVPNNTAGGSASVGANTRPINVEVEDANSICSIASNRIKLAEAGRYNIKVKAAGYYVDYTQLYMYNYTQSRVELDAIGIGGYYNAASSSYELSLSGVIEADAIDDEFEIRQYCSRARATDGLGIPVNSGNANTHLTAEISKV